MDMWLAVRCGDFSYVPVEAGRGVSNVVRGGRLLGCLIRKGRLGGLSGNDYGRKRELISW
jgi:hypothetical protein